MTDQTLIDEAIADAERRMARSVAHFEDEIASIRTGRANTALVDRISVDYYGAPTLLNQMATISTPDARLIQIQPWDRTQIRAIERAIMESDLGLTPGNDGQVIRLPIPAMTQERRQEMVKRLRRTLEETHVAIRNVRRDVLEFLRKSERDKEISEDELRRGQDRLQRTTDAAIQNADRVSSHKEQELMEV